MKDNSGFTLLEVLIAMAILTVGILGLYSMHTTAITGNSRANQLTTAATLNSTQLEIVASRAYNDSSLDDTDGDGTNKDSNKDGVDDGGNNFGLDDATAATADDTFTTADGKFTVFINVAIDVPMENMKTIFVHVQDNQSRLLRPVVFEYYKDDII